MYEEVVDLYQTQLCKERRRIHRWINQAKYLTIYLSYRNTGNILLPREIISRQPSDQAEVM